MIIAFKFKKLGQKIELKKVPNGFCVVMWKKQNVLKHVVIIFDSKVTHSTERAILIIRVHAA